MADVKRQTVSEFIRESKPDWEHVRSRERRASTGAFTGAPVVSTGALAVTRGGRVVGATIDMEYAVGFAEQLEEFDRQNLTGETDAVFGEETVLVDDLGHAEQGRVVGKVGSKLPG